MKALMENPGSIITREQIIKQAYPNDIYISNRNVDCHIKRLRKKIITIAPDFEMIKSVYGCGYKLE